MRYIYLAYGSDESGNQGGFLGAFWHESEARAVSGRHAWGVERHVEKVALYDSIDNYDIMQRQSARRNALEKLTSEERAALGIDG